MNYQNIDKLIKELKSEPENAVSTALKLSNEFMKVVLEGTSFTLREPEVVFNDIIPHTLFPNEKAENWFLPNPFVVGERVALYHFEENDCPLVSKFYCLNSSATKATISAGVRLTPNWEDSEDTRTPGHKVGIDFFLKSDMSGLLVVISNNFNLRVLELSDRLTITQIQILNNIKGAAAFSGLDGAGQQIEFEPQRTIHQTLWNAFELKPVNTKFFEGVANAFELLYQHLQKNKPTSEATDEDLKLFCSRLIGRLLFMWFLQKKGIVEVPLVDGDDYYETKLKPLFFNTLNNPTSDIYLNGGLFSPQTNDFVDEKISFPNQWFQTLFNHFNEYNFTTDESSPEYEQVAIDPEMLGRVFENLLAIQIDETGETARKAKGAFYTPREIVAYMCKESLRQSLYNKLPDSKNGINRLLDTSDADWEQGHSNSLRDTKLDAAQMIKTLDELTILDPACGSGAFPMGMLQLLLKCYYRLNDKLNPYERKLKIMQNNIFGVDIEPMAVEIARLRAWLSIIVDIPDTKHIQPLPNLDFKFVCANSLIPLEPETQIDIFSKLDLGELKEVKDKYFSATDFKSKDKLKQEYLKLTESHSEHGSTREKQLASWNPFDNSKPAEFFDSEFMFGIK